MSLFQAIRIERHSGNLYSYTDSGNVIDVERRSVSMKFKIYTDDITKFGTYDFFYKIRWDASDTGSPKTKGATISFT